MTLPFTRLDRRRQVGEFLMVALAYALPSWQHLVLATACVNAGALLLYPLQALVAGRPLVQAEVFGFAPDPTAIGSLGLLLCADARGRFARGLLGALQGVAVAWCVVSAATLWTMASQQGWVPLIAAVIALAVRWHWPHPSDRRPTGTASRR